VSAARPALPERDDCRRMDDFGPYAFPGNHRTIEDVTRAEEITMQHLDSFNHVRRPVSVIPMNNSGFES
jgi:hypothetical protein